MLNKYKPSYNKILPDIKNFITREKIDKNDIDKKHWKVYGYDI